MMIRRLSSAVQRLAPTVCVVGSGPAGFYTVDSLLKRSKDVQVALLERLPVPFGLVRYGVAPDHPEVKVVEHKFEELLVHPSVELFANVHVGRDVSIKELLGIFDAVVLAHGSESDRHLNVANESAQNIFSAREFVGWYNAHPDLSDMPVDLSKVRDVAVVGNGNVALDVSRILLRRPDELRQTDISQRALSVLEQSTVERVHIVGRRGLSQASWTAKEVREVLFSDSGYAPRIQESELSLSEADEVELGSNRSKRRCVELFLKAHREGRFSQRSCRELHFRTMRAPIKFERNAAGAVSAVALARTELLGPAGSRKAVISQNAAPETLKAELVVKSVGYQNQPLAGVPFDSSRSVVPNTEGKVDGVDRLFVSGWLKRGPSGIIGTNKWDAEETVYTLSASLQPSKKTGRPALAMLDELLKDRGVRRISADAWSNIDREERRRGSRRNSPREKLLDWDSLLKASQTADLSSESVDFSQ